jgi:hypothetical protein
MFRVSHSKITDNGFKQIAASAAARRAARAGKSVRRSPPGAEMLGISHSAPNCEVANIVYGDAPILR